LAVPVTVIGEVVNVCPFVGLLMDTVGGVVSGPGIPWINPKSTPQTFPLLALKSLDVAVETLVVAGM
jgi:hypothetical protein